MLPSFVSTLGWALIHFLWQGTLVGMATAIALMLLRNARPQTRYAVSCAALALCLALPMFGVWRGMQADASSAALPISKLARLIAVPDQPYVAPSSLWQSSLQGQLPWIVALWSIGAGLLALRMAMGMMWVNRIGRSPSGATDTDWQARLNRLAREFGMRRDIRLRVVGCSNGLAIDSPVAARWWRPMVLVPAALIARMPPELLEALLAHELAHIKRHDYLVNLVQSAIEALLFYHPVVWWLSRQIRSEREQIADDLAATALGDPRRLALALQELDLIQQDRLHQGRIGNAGFPNTHLSPAANGGNLMSRIQRLIRPNQHALNWRMALPIIALTAVCLTVYAHDGAPVLAPSAAALTVATRATSAAPVIAPASAASMVSAIASTAAVAAAPASAATAPIIASTGTPRAIQSSIVTIPSAHPRAEAYAVIRAGHEGMSMSGDTRDIPTIERTRKHVRGDFVWVRRGQKTYVVQDPLIVARVVELWQPAQALGAQMEALGSKMRIPSQQMEAIGKQIEALTADGRPFDAAMQKTSAQMAALGVQQAAIGMKMQAIGLQMAQAKEVRRYAMQRQLEVLQAQMQPLNVQMKKLGAQIELHSKEMVRAQLPLQALSEQMDAASQPIKALGKQLEAMGKHEEQLSHDADRAVKALIDQALQNGKGVPAEAAAPN